MSFIKTAFLVRWAKLSQTGKTYPLFWFIIHLIVYSVIMVSAVTVNMIVAPSRPWFLLIVFGWCGLIIIHAQRVMGPSAEPLAMRVSKCS